MHTCFMSHLLVLALVAVLALLELALYCLLTAGPLTTTLILCAKRRYMGGPKTGHRLIAIILSNLNRFQNFVHWKIGKCAVKWILKIVPPYLTYVATLPHETLSAKQALNNKLLGSVATYFVYCWVWVKKIKIGEYLAKLCSKTVVVASTCLHFARLTNTLLREESACTRQSRSCL